MKLIRLEPVTNVLARREADIIIALSRDIPPVYCAIDVTGGVGVGAGWGGGATRRESELKSSETVTDHETRLQTTLLTRQIKSGHLYKYKFVRRNIKIK